MLHRCWILRRVYYSSHWTKKPEIKLADEQLQSDLNYLSAITEKLNNTSLKIETNYYKALKGVHAVAVLTVW